MKEVYGVFLLKSRGGAADFDLAELCEEQLKLRHDKEVQSSQIIRSNGKVLVTSRFDYSIRIFLQNIL